MEIAKLAGRLRGKGLGKIPGARLLYRLLLPKKNTFRKVRVLDFEMWVDLRDMGDLTPSLLSKGVYDPQMTQVVRTSIKPGMTCIDVGANMGYFTLLMARQTSPGKVYAYEPEGRNLNLLYQNLLLNNTTNVTTLPWAISNKTGSTSLVVSKFHYGSHSIMGDKGSTRLDTLDNLHKEMEVNFVKVDAQGAEIGVLEGMKKIINANPDIGMVWEYSPESLRRFGHEPKELLERLEGYGLNLWDIDEKEKKVIKMSSAELEKKYSKKYTNILARR